LNVCRIVCAAAIASPLGCGSAGAVPEKPHPALADRVDVAPTFETGATYTVVTKTGTELDNPVTGKAKFVVSVTSNRAVSRGGAYGRDGLAWTEEVTAVVVSGTQNWDSRADSPVPDEVVGLAALVDSAYDVQISPAGLASVSGLKVPMTRLDAGQKERLAKKLGDLKTIAKGLAGSVAKSLASMPARMLSPGESHREEVANPALAKDARLRSTWTLESLDGAIATFRVAGDYQSQVLASGSLRGRAIFDTEAHLYTLIDLTTELTFQGKGGRVTTTQEIRVTRKDPGM